jgi:hypothetical protein
MQYGCNKFTGAPVALVTEDLFAPMGVDASAPAYSDELPARVFS